MLNQNRKVGPKWAGAWAALALGCVLLAPAGCARGTPDQGARVSGTVLIDGELADSGTVTFHPVDEGAPAVGRIHSDGSYSVRVGQGDLSDPDGGSLAPGEYRVTVIVRTPTAAAIAEGGPPAAGPRLMAKKYASEETTDLRYEVKPGDNVFVLRLDRAAPDASDGGSNEAPEDQGEGESETDSVSTDDATADPNGEEANSGGDETPEGEQGSDEPSDAAGDADGLSDSDPDEANDASADTESEDAP